MDRDTYRQASHAIWQSAAAAWEERRDWVWEASHAVGEWMVEQLDPQPGETVLELAAGAGQTGFAAAGRLGEKGRLISSDFAPEMVEAARRVAQERGIANAEFRVIDAEAIDLPDDGVDGVLCRWGYMLMAEPPRALAETRRVLKEGGRLACSTWGEPERNLWASVPARLLVEHGHLPPPQPGQPGIFGISTEARLRELLEQAGFREVRTEAVEMSWSFETRDEYWDFLMRIAGAISMVLEKLPEDELATIRSELDERLRSEEADGGYEMSGVCVNALAS